MAIVRLKINQVLLLIFSVIGTAVMLVSNRFVQQLSDEERQKIDLWVMAIKQLALPDKSDSEYTFTFEVLRNNRTIPVVLVDGQGRVLDYMNIAQSQMDTPAKVEQMLERMARKHAPIEFLLYDEEKNIVYYDDSSTLKRLSLYPYVLLAVILAFIVISYYAIQQSLRAEQNGVWVGLAKETAHQLGTPTSSLMACLDLLRQEALPQGVVDELAKDIHRLERITQRFSKIGSRPDLQLVDIGGLVEGAVSYLSGRLSRQVSFATHLPSVPLSVQANPTLMEWVLENLVKNGVDAMQGVGRIDVSVSQAGDWVCVDVADTGRGIARSNFKAVFNPGFTTKSRGWGLGLTLAKRIVEDYHHGRIFVHSSELMRGTTFRVMLRCANA